MTRSHTKGAQQNALYITLDGGEYSYWYSYSFLSSKQKGLYFAKQTKSQIFLQC